MLLSRDIVKKNFLSEWDNSRCGLSCFEFAEDMALIVRRRRRFLGDKRKNVLVFDGHVRVLHVNAPAMVVRVESKVCDAVAWVVFAEEQLSWVIRQRYSLWSDFNMNFGRFRQWSTLKQHTNRFANCLRSRQRFRVDAEEIKNIASSALRHQLKLCWWWEISLLNIPFWQNQTARKCQRSDWMLVNEGRQRAEDRLVAAALQTNTADCWFNQKVTNEFINSTFWSRWWLSDADDQTKSIWKKIPLKIIWKSLKNFLTYWQKLSNREPRKFLAGHYATSWSLPREWW